MRCALTVCGIEECRAVIEPLDHQGKLLERTPRPGPCRELDDEDEFLAEFGVDAAGSVGHRRP